MGHSAERDAAVTRIAYIHAPDCSWLTNNSWCDCGLDEAIERTIKDEAVANADRLYAMSEAAADVARDLLAFNPGHGDFLTAGKTLRAALTTADPRVTPPAEPGADR